MHLDQLGLDHLSPMGWLEAVPTALSQLGLQEEEGRGPAETAAAMGEVYTNLRRVAR